MWLASYVHWLSEKYHIEVPEHESTIWKWNGKVYEMLNKSDINTLAGKHLGRYHGVLSRSQLEELIDQTT